MWLQPWSVVTENGDGDVLAAKDTTAAFEAVVASGTLGAPGAAVCGVARSACAAPAGGVPVLCASLMTTSMLDRENSQSFLQLVLFGSGSMPLAALEAGAAVPRAMDALEAHAVPHCTMSSMSVSGGAWRLCGQGSVHSLTKTQSRSPRAMKGGHMFVWPR